MDESLIALPSHSEDDAEESDRDLEHLGVVQQQQQREGEGEDPDLDAEFGPLDLTQDLDGLMALTQQLDEEELAEDEDIAGVQSRVDRYMLEGQQRLVGQADHGEDGRIDVQSMLEEVEAIWQ